MERVIDYFLELAPNAPITAPQQKNPFDNQGVLVGLRSVADSNRRTRFCRPLPSHSVNRPFSYQNKEHIHSLQTSSVADCSPAPRDRELLHFVQSVRTAVRGFADRYLATRLTDHYHIKIKNIFTLSKHHRWRIALPLRGIASSFTSFSRFEPPYAVLQTAT